MTSISSALPLVDPIGQVATRPAPAIALNADSGFDAIFARVLDQPDRSSRSDVTDRESQPRTDRADGASRQNDSVARREPVRSKDRSDDVGPSRSDEVSTTSSAGQTDEASDDEDVARSAVDGTAAAALAGMPGIGAPALVSAPATTPSLAPGVVTDAPAPGVTALAEAVSAATAPAVTAPITTAPAQQVLDTAAAPGDVAAEQSIAVPTEPVAEVIAALQAEALVPPVSSTDAAPEAAPGAGEQAAVSPTSAEGAGTASGTAAAPAGTVPGSELGAGADGNPASNSGNQSSAGDTSAHGQNGQVVQATPDAPVEPVATPTITASSLAASDDGSSSGATSDTRSSSSSVGSVSATGTTTTERVEASTVRATGPDGQRPVDGRVRDRFVGSGLGASMTVDLSDEGLGQLSMQAHQGGGALHVTLAAGESSTRELLLGQSATLRSELEASGTRLGSFDVTDQLPGDTSRNSRGEDTSGQGAPPRSDRRPGHEVSAARTGAHATTPLSSRSAGSTGIDLLI